MREFALERLFSLLKEAIIKEDFDKVRLLIDKGKILSANNEVTGASLIREILSGQLG